MAERVLRHHVEAVHALRGHEVCFGLESTDIRLLVVRKSYFDEPSHPVIDVVTGICGCGVRGSPSGNRFCRLSNVRFAVVELSDIGWPEGHPPSLHRGACDWIAGPQALMRLNIRSFSSSSFATG